MIEIHRTEWLALLQHATPVVKLVIFLLILASMVCWTVIIAKWRHYRRVIRACHAFKIIPGESLDALSLRYRTRTHEPIPRMLLAGIQAIHDHHIAAVRAPVPMATERLTHAMMVALNREIETLSAGLSLLASVGSSATFVGLFGTVWGIMDSFQSIATTHNMGLSVVAPGIAEALFATAIGLFAAIPAMIGYNYCSATLSHIGGRLEDGATELRLFLSPYLEE